MDPAFVCLWGLSTGVAYGYIARRVDRRRLPVVRERVQDFYVLGWYGLSATGFAAAGSGLASWWGADDVALVSTLQLALIVSFVLAVGALLASGAHYALSRRASPHPKG